MTVWSVTLLTKINNCPNIPSPNKQTNRNRVFYQHFQFCGRIPATYLDYDFTYFHNFLMEELGAKSPWGKSILVKNILFSQGCAFNPYNSMKLVSWKETLEQFSCLCIWINLLLKCIEGHLALSCCSSCPADGSVLLVSLPSHAQSFHGGCFCSCYCFPPLLLLGKCWTKVKFYLNRARTSWRFQCSPLVFGHFKDHWLFSKNLSIIEEYIIFYFKWMRKNKY